jgi:hypothetical protein
MKRFSFTLIAICFLSLAFVSKAQQVIVSDDAAYTTPASGAMLDVYSTSKGFMPPRVALTGRTDAGTITSPSTGLMVYNTATAGIAPNDVIPGYYFNSGTSGSPSWTRVMNTDLTNGMSFASDGSPVLNGTATVFNDLVSPGTAGYSASTNPPALSTFLASIQCYFFGDISNQANEHQVFFAVQMPHDWKDGSTIYPHIHWSPQSSVNGSVVWGFEYTWANYESAAPAAFPDRTIIYTPAAAASSGDNDKHFITSFGSVSGSGKKISSILICRLFRNSSNALDTYAGSAAMLSFDIHYEIDGMGSREIFTK